MAAKKGSAKKLVAKKTAVVKAAIAAPSEPVFTLDGLAQALGEPSPSLTTLVFGARTDDELLALGTDFTSVDVLESTPRFLGTAMAYCNAAEAANRKPVMGVSKGYLALAVRESISLRGLLRDSLSKVGGSAAVRRKRLADANTSARALSGQVIHALGGLVPARGPIRDKLRACSAGTPTPEELAVALETLSGVVVSARAAASEEERSEYDALGITESIATALSDQANALREAADIARGGSPTKSIDQRTLDLQDGRVLYLITHIHRAFREAHAADSTVVLPPLGRLQRLASRPTKPAVTSGEPKTV